MPSFLQSLRLANGGAIALDQRLGGSGEGTVYAVAGRPDRR